MKRFFHFSKLILPCILVLASLTGHTQREATSLKVPIDYYKLSNGLKVVLSVDTVSPVVVIGVYYNIGFRNEPRNRTGFAHLFEHLMFQGSKNLGKMEFIKLIQENGGVLNGSTRFDFTNYFEILPAHKLETILWAEADRMKGLDISQANLANQQGVVKNEIRVNVLNQPYGGFPWLDMPQYANENWHNAHNFYGDMSDLDSAKLEDVAQFFKTFYAPNNAVLVVSGDFEIPKTKNWIEKYFAKIPPEKEPPPADLTEPLQTAEKRFIKPDSLANKPAIALAYKMPVRNSPEYFAMGLIDQMLLQGNDSKLYEALVQENGYTSNVSGGINYLGNMFNYYGPMLWMADLVYDSTVSPDSITRQFDLAINSLTQGVTEEQLNLAKIKMRSQLYTMIGSNLGVGKVDVLASYALFDNNPAKINNLEASFQKVTPALIEKTAREYLKPANRTILIIEPKKRT